MRKAANGANVVLNQLRPSRASDNSQTTSGLDGVIRLDKGLGGWNDHGEQVEVGVT